MTADKDGQLLLDFEAKKRKKPHAPDYEAIAIWIGDRIVSRQELQQYTGIYGSAIKNVIDVLSINYTLYDVNHGYYRMMRPVRRKEKSEESKRPV